MTALSVLIADPQRMFAEALTTALRADHGLGVAGEHPRAGADLVRAVDAHHPDVVLCEYWLEDMQVPAATRALHARAPATTVIVVSWLPGPPQISEALKAGAAGFVTKYEPVAHLVDGIHRAHAGEWPIFKDDLEQLIGRITTRAEGLDQASSQFNALTPREMEVLRLIGHGLDARHIARHLKLTERTVRSYITNILSKTNTSSQVEVLSLARDQGIIL